MTLPAPLVRALAWVRAHRKTLTTDVAVLAGALGAQPAIHDLLGGRHVAAAALISALAAGVGALARTLVKG